METNTSVSTLSADQQEIVTSLVLNGDLSKMQPAQKVDYYNRFCGSLGLNPLTQPFQLINFQGKQKMYATKDCTDQLRKIYGISITDMKSEIIAGSLYKVVVTAQDKGGRTDAATGVLSIDNLKGEALSNAIMKAESKAKRRVTLSICGLGILDESEVEGMQKGAAQNPEHSTTTVETIDTEYEAIDVSDIPDEIINAVKDAETVEALKEVWASQKDLQALPNFKQLVNKRKADLELSALQQKFGTDGK